MNAPLRNGWVLTPAEKRQFYTPKQLRLQAESWRARARGAQREDNIATERACVRQADRLVEMADLLESSGVVLGL